MPAIPRTGHLLLAAVTAASTFVVLPVLAPALGSELIVSCGGLEATIVGTAGPDELIGTESRDVIAGLDGDDLIMGLGGADIICGGSGDDEIVGNRGRDRIHGGGGADVIRGGSGPDRIFGNGGDDVLTGQLGKDAISGGSGSDVIAGGRDRDQLTGGRGDDTVLGGPGDDVIAGDSAITTLESAGQDELRGGGGIDRVVAMWDYGDGDASGLIYGGAGFDMCGDGATQTACEWDGVTHDPELWRPLVRRVFNRWGLAEKECSTAGGPLHCVRSQVANAVAVMACESGGDPFAVNPSSGTTGLFQHQQGVYWSSRVDRVITNHADKEPDFPADASAFDPEHNVIVAAMLVWESKQTQLLGEVNFGGVAPAVYPEFNFDVYAQSGYGYTNWGEGPEPWGHWVGCASTGPPYDGLGLYDAAWIHPWAEKQWP